MRVSLKVMYSKVVIRLDLKLECYFGSLLASHPALLFLVWLVSENSC